MFPNDVFYSSFYEGEEHWRPMFSPNVGRREEIKPRKTVLIDDTVTYKVRAIENW